MLSDETGEQIGDHFPETARLPRVGYAGLYGASILASLEALRRAFATSRLRSAGGFAGG